eukprot:3205449-Rhodomonas_salina.1
MRNQRVVLVLGLVLGVVAVRIQVSGEKAELSNSVAVNFQRGCQLSVLARAQPEVLSFKRRLFLSEGQDKQLSDWTLRNQMHASALVVQTVLQRRSSVFDVAV